MTADRSPLYRITDWDTHCEVSTTRKLKHLTWIKLPTKMDGEGYLTLVFTGRGVRGAALYGAWNTLLLIASRCKPRGTLVQTSGLPHTPATLSRRTRLPKSLYVQLLPLLVETGWLEICQCGGGLVAESASAPAESPAQEKSREEENREEKGGSPPTPQVDGDGNPDWIDLWIRSARNDWPMLDCALALRDELEDATEAEGTAAMLILVGDERINKWGPKRTDLRNALASARDEAASAGPADPRTAEELSAWDPYLTQLTPAEYGAFCRLGGVEGGRDEQRRRVKAWDEKRKQEA